MANFNPNAKLTVSQRSYNNVKRAVDKVYKSPVHRTVIAAVGGVNAVAAGIHALINSPGFVNATLGKILDAVERLYTLMGTFQAKWHNTAKEIISNI